MLDLDSLRWEVDDLKSSVSGAVDALLERGGAVPRLLGAFCLRAETFRDGRVRLRAQGFEREG